MTLQCETTLPWPVTQKLVHSMSAAQSTPLTHPDCLPVIPDKLLECLASLQEPLLLSWCCWGGPGAGVQKPVLSMFDFWQQHEASQRCEPGTEKVSAHRSKSSP